MAKQKEPKHFIVKYKGDVLEITTDSTKPKTLEALLRLIFREYNRVNSDKLVAFMERMTNGAKNMVNRGKPPELEPELEVGFDFFKALMERPREL